MHERYFDPRLRIREYFEHTPFDKYVLYSEVQSGVLTREDFCKFLSQELAKYSSRLYKGRDIFPVAWHRVIEFIEKWNYTFNKKY
jgi:hypothetical protein